MSVMFSVFASNVNLPSSVITGSSGFRLIWASWMNAFGAITRLEPTVRTTWLSPSAVQLVICGSFETQPAALCGTKASVPGSGAAQVASPQASVTMILLPAFSVAGIGAKLSSMDWLIRVMPRLNGSSCVRFVSAGGRICGRMAADPVTA